MTRNEGMGVDRGWLEAKRELEREVRGIAGVEVEAVGVRRVARYVLVAFKVNEENSVYYRKCRDIEELKKALQIAFEVKGADFVSIRKVR